MFNKRIQINFVSNILYQMSLLFLPLLISPYLTRALGAEPLGRYQYASTVVLYFCSFCMLGISTYGNRECAIARGDKRKLSEVFWGIYGIQLCASTLALLAYLGYLFLMTPQDFWMGIFQIPQLLSYALDITWLYYGLEYFYKIALRNFLIKIASMILIFLLVRQPGDAYLYCLIMTGTTLLSQAILWPMAAPFLENRKISFRDMAPHIRQVFILFLPSIAISVYSSIDKIMIGNMIGSTEVAIYSYAENLAKLPVGIVTALTTVMLPHLSKMVAEHKTEESRKYVHDTMNVTLFLALPIAAGIGAIADKMVPWFYAEEFLPCIPLIKMLVIIIVFLAWTYVVQNQCLIPMHKDSVLVKSAFLTAVLNVTANLLLIPRYGIQGAAVGTILSELLVAVYKTSHCGGGLRVGKALLDNLWTLISALIMYVCVYELGEWLGTPSIRTTFLQIGAGVAIYLILSVPTLLKWKKQMGKKEKK